MGLEGLQDVRFALERTPFIKALKQEMQRLSQRFTDNRRCSGALDGWCGRLKGTQLGIRAPVAV